jgi:hypothetical protein
MMLRALCVVAAVVLLAPVAAAVDRDFKDIVQAMSHELRAKPTRIPMMGLVNFVSFVARPAGVRHIDIAVFENLNGRGLVISDLRAKVEQTIGRGWQPFVQVVSRRKGTEETVLVYMRPDGNDCRLLVASVGRDEATLVQLRLNPEGLQRWVSEPRGAALNATVAAAGNR